MGDLYPHLSYDGVNYRHQWSSEVTDVSIVRLRRQTNHYRSTLPNGAALQRSSLYRAVVAKDEAGNTETLVDKVGLNEAHISNLYIVRTEKPFSGSSEYQRALYKSLFDDPQRLATDATIIFVQAKDDTAYEAWKAKIPWLNGLDSSRYMTMDTMTPYPKQDDNVFMEHEFISVKAALTRRKLGRVAQGSQEYAQHKVTLVSWKGGGHNVKSQNWDPVKREDIPTDGTKYYLSHDKFEPIWGKITDAQYGYGSLSDLLESFDSKHKITLYGVRRRDLAELQKDTTFKPFEEYAVSTVTAMLRNASDLTEDRFGWWMASTQSSPYYGSLRTGTSAWMSSVRRVPGLPKFMVDQVADMTWAGKVSVDKAKWAKALQSLADINPGARAEVIQAVYPQFTDSVLQAVKARYVAALPETVSFVSVDASFISLKLLLPVCVAVENTA